MLFFGPQNSIFGSAQQGEESFIAQNANVKNINKIKTQILKKEILEIRSEANPTRPWNNYDRIGLLVQSDRWNLSDPKELRSDQIEHDPILKSDRIGKLWKKKKSEK